MTQARYDDVADFYTSGFDSTGDPATQGLLDLLGPVAGLRVLDVACGHGRITRELARRGALAVGIDISGQLIRKARENRGERAAGLALPARRYCRAGSPRRRPVRHRDL